jgi:excisionase family DNA binding protein
MPLSLSKQEKDMGYPKANCARCGIEFPKRRDFARFCSDRCRVAHAQVDRAITIINTHLATVGEAARIAGVSKSTIRRWARAGRLRVKTVVGRVLVYRSDVEGSKG